MTAALGNTHWRDNLAWLHDSFIITGSVSGAGAVAAGSGFSASRASAGRYTVTFSVAFAAAPVFVAEVIATTGNEDLTITSPGTGSVQVNVNNGGTPTDAAFWFAAIAVH